MPKSLSAIALACSAALAGSSVRAVAQVDVLQNFLGQALRQGAFVQPRPIPPNYGYQRAVPVRPNPIAGPAGPSFDCRRAYSAAMMAMCRSPELAQRDREMAQAYADVVHSGYDPVRLKADQRDWLAARDACSGDEACLRNTIVGRTTELRRMLSSDGETAQGVPGTSPSTGLQTTPEQTIDGVPVIGHDGQAFFMLVALGLKPTLLDDHAQQYAYRFLPHTSPFADVTKWSTGNEFSDLDFKRAFIAQYGARLRSLAPRVPFRFVVGASASLGHYDDQRHGFPLSWSGRYDLSAAVAEGLGIEGDLDASLDFLPMGEAQARGLIDDLRRSGPPRTVTIATEVQVTAADPESMTLSVRSVRTWVYTPDYRTRLYEYHRAPTFAAPAPGWASNALSAWMAPPAGLRSWRFETLDGAPVVDDLRTVMQMVALGGTTDAPGATAPLQRGQALAREMLVQKDFEAYFTRYGSNYALKGANEFERSATRDRFEREVLPKLRTLAPRLPFDFVALARPTLSEYDAGRGGFPIPGNYDFGIVNAAQNAGLALSQSFAWPALFLPSTTERGPAILAALSSRREVTVAAHVRLEPGDAVQPNPRLRLVSIGIYAPGSKDPLYSLPVVNDADPRAGDAVGMRFAGAPVLDPVLLCAEMMSVEFPGRDDRIAPCWSIVRQRDARAYAPDAAPRVASDATAPFFPRGDLPMNEENKRRFVDWGRRYAAAAAARDVAFDAQRERSVPGALTYEAVGEGLADDTRGMASIAQSHHLRMAQLVALPPLGDISTMLVLPNVATAYDETVARGRLNADSDGGAEATATLRLGSPEVVRDDAGKLVLLVPATPERVRVLTHAGVPLAERSFEDVVPIGGAPSKVGPGSASAVPLDAALIDLLVARASGSSLPREALAYLVARRWTYERGENGTIDRFFPIGGARPAPEEAAATGGAFVVWATNHVPALPLKVRVKGSFDGVKGAKPVAGWDAFSCFTTSFSTLMSQTGGGNRTPFHEAAGPCRDVDVRLPFADPLHVYVDLDDEVPAPDVTALGGSEALASTADLTLVDVRSFDHQPTASDIGRSDGQIPIAPRERSSAGQPFVDLRLHVDSVAFADARSGTPVAALGGGNRDERPAGSEVAHAPSSEAPRTGSGDGRDGGPGTPEPGDAVPDGRHPPTTMPFGPKLVDVRLGMSLAEAEQIVRRAMHVEAVVEGPAGAQSPLVQRAFMGREGTDIVSIYSYPPAGDFVVGISRRVALPTPPIGTATAEQLLVQKYGPPAQVSNTTTPDMFWPEDPKELQGPCGHFSPLRSGSGRTKLVDGAIVAMRSSRGEVTTPTADDVAASGFGALYSVAGGDLNYDLKLLHSCPTTIWAHVDTGASDPNIRTAVFAGGWLAGFVERNQGRSEPGRIDSVRTLLDQQ